MVVTEDWLEKQYGALIPKDYFCMTERYAKLLDIQKDVRLFEEWLERVYGILVPRSLKGRRLHYLVVFFSQTSTGFDRHCFGTYLWTPRATQSSQEKGPGKCLMCM